MALTPKGKVIWGSKQGGDLMRAMLGTQPMTQQERRTLEQLKQTKQDGQMQAEPMPEKQQNEQQV